MATLENGIVKFEGKDMVKREDKCLGRVLGRIFVPFHVPCATIAKDMMGGEMAFGRYEYHKQIKGVQGKNNGVAYKFRVAAYEMQFGGECGFIVETEFEKGADGKYSMIKA